MSNKVKKTLVFTLALVVAMQPFSFFLFNQKVEAEVTRNYEFYFTLVDTVTDKDIMPINNGDEISVPSLPNKENLSVRVDAFKEGEISIGQNGKAIPPMSNFEGSMAFVVNGEVVKKFENFAPFALGPNVNLREGSIDYFNWDFEMGSQSLTVILFSGKNATGKILDAHRINFELNSAELLLPNPGEDDTVVGPGEIPIIIEPIRGRR